MKKLYFLVSILFSAAIPIANAQAPANDNFANRQTIGAGLTTTNIASATVEAGEPSTSAGHTVWYSYTATSDSIITLDTTGTAFQFQFVSVFMGTAINNLLFIDRESSDHTSTPQRVVFKAKSGATYQICAGHNTTSFGSSSPVMKLTLLTTPFSHSGVLYSNTPSNDGYITNDLFANSLPISGSSLTAINYMNDSTSEAGEPYTINGRTAWYTYTADSDLVVTLDTTGTEFSYHFLAVYMGTSVNSLIKIISNDSNYSTSPFTLQFKAKKGSTYKICIGRAASSINYDASLFQLTLTSTPFTYAGALYGPEVPTAPTPKNDSFYTPQVLTGNLLTVIGSTASATIEPGESGLSETLWYHWTATANKLVRVDFPAGSFGAFAAFTGSSPQTVVEVVKRPESTPLSYGFDAIAGTTYKLLIGSTSAPFQFTLTALDPPVNYGPVSKITFPRNGQIVSKKGFIFKGTVNDDGGDDAVVAFQFRVNGKTVISYPGSQSLFSGKLKKGKNTLQMRAKDNLGKWGAYHTIKVTAK